MTQTRIRSFPLSKNLIKENWTEKPEVETNLCIYRETTILIFSKHTKQCFFISYPSLDISYHSKTPSDTRSLNNCWKKKCTAYLEDNSLLFTAGYNHGRPWEVLGPIVLWKAYSVLCVLEQSRVDNSSAGFNWEQLVQSASGRLVRHKMRVISMDP
jgi:hypothetical protein